MAKTVWGASPLSTAANWLEKELFGTREAAKAAPIPPPPPPPPVSASGTLDFSQSQNSSLIALLEDI